MERININKLTTDEVKQLGLRMKKVRDITSIEENFCSCGFLLIPKVEQRKFRKFGRSFQARELVAVCANCKAVFMVEHWYIVTFRRREISGLFVVIDKREDLVVLPTVRHYCKKCKKGTDHSFWTRQLRSADESETSFYKCRVCGTTDRESL